MHEPTTAERFAAIVRDVVGWPGAEADMGFAVREVLAIDEQVVVVGDVLGRPVRIAIAQHAAGFATLFDSLEDAAEVFATGLRHLDREGEEPEARTRAAVEARHPGIRWLTVANPFHRVLRETSVR